MHNFIHESDALLMMYTRRAVVHTWEHTNLQTCLFFILFSVWTMHVLEKERDQSLASGYIPLLTKTVMDVDLIVS